MRLAVSNHGQRWAKRAFEAEIPSVLMRAYQEVIEAPRRWVWKDEWVFANLKFPMRMIHGCGYSGPNAARNAALDSRMNTIIGHVHSHAGVSYINQMGFGQTIWAMNVGCLIDSESLAFE
jgi:hypothetical protein